MIIRIINKYFICMLVFVLFIAASYSVDSIEADTVEILTSEDIIVEGFQIKMIETDDGVAFRTVSKAPDVGRQIVVRGKSYTVTNLGTIFCKDPNTSGVNQNNVLDKSYTEVKPIPYYQQGENTDYKYVGAKEYNGQNLTFGYIATNKGVFEKIDGITTYVMTMTNMDSIMTNTIRVRAFVEAVDKEGKEVIIYGQYAVMMSVAEIANKIYAGSMAYSEETHKYIYNNILSKISPDNPFYRDVEEEYGWGGSVEV